MDASWVALAQVLLLLLPPLALDQVLLLPPRALAQALQPPPPAQPQALLLPREGAGGRCRCTGGHGALHGAHWRLLPLHTWQQRPRDVRSGVRAEHEG